MHEGGDAGSRRTGTRSRPGRAGPTHHDVVVAGAGPTGLMLAGELALAGTDVAIVERRPDQLVEGPRALGLHARTIEVLDQRGIADRFLDAGQAVQVQSFSAIPVDISDFPSRHPYGLALPQQQFEPILAAWVEELGVPVYRSREVTGFAQDADGVDVGLSDGSTMHAGYLVGCDGGRSLVRKAAGIEFTGWDPSVASVIAEVNLEEEPAWGLRRTAVGQHAIGRLPGAEKVRVLVSRPADGRVDEPTLDDLRSGMVDVWGTDYGAHSPAWISRFTDMARQAAAYRVGRVLLAGDAAHVHYPIGGQGMNTGIQDAVNLGWKLAQVVRGVSSETLLDTYQAERHPVAARVLRTTMAQTALTRGDDRTDALRDSLTELLALDEPRRVVGGMLSGLDIAYDLGGDHPLVGRRMPDLELETDGGSTRVSTLLHAARPLVLDFGGRGVPTVSAGAGSLPVLDVRTGGPWELPVVGVVSAPDVAVVRPDGHVAWVGAAADPGLAASLAMWFGAPR